MRRDYAVSFAAEGVAVVISLLVYRLAASQWTTELFAEYALARKILSAILVVGLVSMDTAIVWALASEPSDDRTAGGQLSGALLVGGVASGAIVLAFVSAPQTIALALFGEPGHERLVPAMGIFTLGATLLGIAYGSERGRLRLVRAGALLVLQAAVPLIAVLVFSGSVADALAAMGIGWAAVAALLFAGSWRRILERPHVRGLLSYGAPRSGGLLLQMGFLAAPAVVAAHRFGIVEGGNVAFALLVLGTTSTLLTPIGVVLLPRGVQMARSSPAQLRGHVRALLTLVLPLLALGVIVVELTADVLVRSYLGPAYAGAAPALRGLIWAALPWGLFVTLRSLLDATDVRPLNARNVVVAVIAYGLFVGIAAASGGDEALYYAAFVAAVVILGALTGLEAARAVSVARLQRT